MSTGVPIYLVSACTTGEEFVAAFRRYADRNGLFVPMAEPLPTGRKGHVAVTLRDGGVMVEGQAEIVSSGKTPSIVHGRVGITLKFVEPDAPSKTMLVELEKARLAMKPPPPSVPPRPSTIPAEPRPVPPAPAGRIDASNALAECVAIGDLSTLGVVETAPAKPGPRFVVPTIPPVGSAPTRPRTSSGPPVNLPRPASATTPPSVPPIPSTYPRNPTGPTPALPPLGKSATGPLPVPTARTTQAAAVVPPPQPGVAGTSDTMVAVTPVADVKSKITTTQAAAVVPPPPRAPADAGDDDGDDTIDPPPPSSGALVPIPQTDTIDIEANLSLIGDASDTPVVPMPVVSPGVLVHEEKTLQASVVPPRPPAKPAPVVEAPMPPIVADVRPTFDVEIAEPTDLTEMPMDPESFAPPHKRETREPRRTSIGVAVVPYGVTVLPARPPAGTDDVEEPRDTALMTAMTAGIVGPRSVDGRAKTLPPNLLEVQEPTPSGDWTISTGPDTPTIEPTRRAPATPAGAAKADDRVADAVADPKDPTNLPTGDWTIALDSDSPDGWTPPEKVQKKRGTGPPVSAVASAEPLDSRREPERPPEDSGPKVHVDPTLIQPLTPMPLDDTPMPSGSGSFDAASSQPMFAPQEHPIIGPGPISATPMPAAYPAAIPTPLPVQKPVAFPMDPSQSSAMAFAGNRGSAPVLAGPDPTTQTKAGHRRRVFVIAASAVLVLVAAIVAVVVLGGAKDPVPQAAPEKPPEPTRAAEPPRTSVTPVGGSGSDSGSDAGSGSAMIASPPPVGPCTIAITTVPDGAELLVDGAVVGTSPQTLTLPCDAPAKLVVRKARFAVQSRTLQPTADSKPLKLVLQKLLFTVKISSKPPGATVSLDDKSLGVTPMITKLPAFEASTLVFTKAGFAKERQQITPKTNNQAIQATLKKSAGKPRR